MKRIIVILGLIVSIGAYAQESPSTAGKEGKGLIKGEVYLGIGTPLFSVGSIRNEPIFMAGAELRYHFPQSPWSFGFGSRVMEYKRIYNEGFPVYISSQHYVVADYNYRISPSFTLFAGVEGGVSISYDMSRHNSTANPYGVPGVEADVQKFYMPQRVSPYFGPRLGFEAWNHLRGVISIGIMDKGDSNVNFRLGYTF